MKRLAFIDSFNINPLIRGIQQITGTPVEHMIIDFVHKDARGYLGLYVSDDVRDGH